MSNFSIVISLKNAGNTIESSIKSFLPVTDDIILFDNGSTDDTRAIASRYPVKMIKGEWKGFGQTKNDAVTHAAYDWILSLDADESIDRQLQQSLTQQEFIDDNIVYELNFKTFLGNKWVRFGEWGIDRHIRLFNRNRVRWNDALVHETLVLPPGHRVVRLRGYVLHRTVENIEQYGKKMRNYAMMNAEKYFHEGKRTTSVKKYISPAFSFIKNYFFRLGFLDGRTGLTCARMTATYTYLKYKKLEELYQAENAEKKRNVNGEW